MKGVFIFLKVKKGMFILLGLIISLNLYSSNNPKKIKVRMQNFFYQTLVNTYGEEPKEDLYGSFLTDFKENKGKVELEINKKELENINKVLFKKKRYNYFYPNLLFYDSYTQYKSSSIGEKEERNTILFFGKKKNTVTKYGIYLNKPKYFEEFVNANSDVEQISHIKEYYSATGILSYFTFVDIMLRDTTVFNNYSIEEFTAVIFWKYLCEQVDIDFHK